MTTVTLRLNNEQLTELEHLISVGSKINCLEVLDDCDDDEFTQKFNATILPDYLNEFKTPNYNQNNKGEDDGLLKQVQLKLDSYDDVYKIFNSNYNLSYNLKNPRQKERLDNMVKWVINTYEISKWPANLVYMCYTQQGRYDHQYSEDQLFNELLKRSEGA